MVNNILYYTGNYKDYSTLNIKLDFSDMQKKEVASILFNCAKNALLPAFELAGINTALVKKLYKEKSARYILKELSLSSDFMPILNSFIGYLKVSKQLALEPIISNMNIIPNAKEDGILSFVFKKDEIVGIKKVNAKEAKPEEASSFFAFVYDNSLKYAFRLLNIKVKDITLKGTGMKKIDYALEQTKELNAIERAYSIYKAFKTYLSTTKSKSAFAPFPTQIMLIKAYPHLKIRRR